MALLIRSRHAHDQKPRDAGKRLAQGEVSKPEQERQPPPGGQKNQDSNYYASGYGEHFGSCLPSTRYGGNRRSPQV
jgi:hypothetical protein